LGNELNVDSAYLSGFCNFQQPLELRRHRLLISRFQVRVLGGSLLNFLQIAGFFKSSSATLLLVFGSGPAELLPQVLWDQLVYPFEDVGGLVAYGLVGQSFDGGLARQDDGRGHTSVEGHADVGV
jgi:hypothetical protein